MGALVLLAGVLSASQETTEGDCGRGADSGHVTFRAATSVLMPGASGSELHGKGGSDGHIDFRVDFGADLLLSANGGAGVGFDPSATYSVLVEWGNADGVWLATTRVWNLSAGGVLVYEQLSHPIAGGADEVRVDAQVVYDLDVR